MPDEKKPDGSQGDDGKAKEEVAKYKKIAEEAEGVLQKWANEIGEVRKERDALVKERDEFKAIIAELKGKGTLAAGGKTETSPEEVEKTLGEEQRKAVEDVFAQFSPEEKVKFHEDPEFRKQVLETAHSSIKSVPASPWTTPTASAKKRPDATAKRIQELFNKAKQRSQAQPAGPQGGAHGATGDVTQVASTPKRGPVAIGVFGR